MTLYCCVLAVLAEWVDLAKRVWLSAEGYSSSSRLSVESPLLLCSCRDLVSLLDTLCSVLRMENARTNLQPTAKPGHCVSGSRARCWCFVQTGVFLSSSSPLSLRQLQRQTQQRRMCDVKSSSGCPAVVPERNTRVATSAKENTLKDCLVDIWLHAARVICCRYRCLHWLQASFLNLCCTSCTAVQTTNCGTGAGSISHLCRVTKTLLPQISILAIQ